MSPARTPKYKHPAEDRALLAVYQDAWNKAWAGGGRGSDVAHLAGLRAVLSLDELDIAGFAPIEETV